MSNNIKVAVIGAGMMGKNHMKTYKSLPGVELVGVYDIFSDAAKAAGARVVGTGRSDFPNQVNNVVAFPGISKELWKDGRRRSQKK